VVRLRVVGYLSPEAKCLLAVVGDGPRDALILREVASKLNGHRGASLALTQLPLTERKGLSALEGVVELLNRGYRVEGVLLLVDKEHVASFKAVEDWLRKRGFDTAYLQELGPKAAVLEASRGHRRLKVYLAVAGDSKSMEEDVEKLIRKVCREEVGELETTLLKRLIQRASVDQVRRAFDGLAKALEALLEL